MGEDSMRTIFYLCVALWGAFAGVAARAEYVVTTFEAPGALPNSTGTYVSDINNARQAVGTVVRSPSETKSFLYSGGVFTMLEVPSPGGDNHVQGMNHAGANHGAFSGPDSQGGFLYAEGTFTPLIRAAGFFT